METTDRPPNEFELAADAYMATCIPLKQFECALRQAFYAGCQYGIDTATKVYRPDSNTATQP